MKPQIVSPQWLSLPLETRLLLAKMFEIPKSGGVVSETDMGHTTVTCDGHTTPDLAHLSVEKMQEYLDTKEDNPWNLLRMTAEKATKSVEPAPIEEVIEQKVSGAKKCCGSKGFKHKKGCVEVKAKV